MQYEEHLVSRIVHAASDVGFGIPVADEGERGIKSHKEHRSVAVEVRGFEDTAVRVDQHVADPERPIVSRRFVFLQEVKVVADMGNAPPFEPVDVFIAGRIVGVLSDLERCIGSAHRGRQLQEESLLVEFRRGEFPDIVPVRDENRVVRFVFERNSESSPLRSRAWDHGRPGSGHKNHSARLPGASSFG